MTMFVNQAPDHQYSCIKSQL